MSTGNSPGAHQILVDFKDQVNSLEVNDRLLDHLQVGIYSGGYLTKVNDTTVSISTFVAEIGDGYHQVRINSTAAITQTVSSTNIYVVLRWSYTGTTPNPATIVSTTLGSVLATDLILGKCLFSGSTLTAIDYSVRSNPFTFAKNLFVEPTETPGMSVRVRGGIFNTGSVTYSITDQLSSTITAPVSNPRIDVIGINSSGAVVILTGTEAATPSAPSYGSTTALAEITLQTSSTTITTAMIRNVRTALKSNPPNPTIVRTIVWFIPDSLTAGTEQGGKVYVPFSGTIIKARVNCKTAPTGQSLLVDINKNGSSIWNNVTANELTLTTGASYMATTSFYATAVTAEDYFTMDIDQVGLSNVGSDLTIMLDIQQS